MGLYAIDCPQCKKPHLWFSGNLDQRCAECQKPKECTCDASWSGRDDKEWCARGAPSCSCGIIDKTQQSMDEHMIKTSSAKKL